MKKAVSKSTILPNKGLKTTYQKDQSTGVNSHQRSHNISHNQLK